MAPHSSFRSAAAAAAKALGHSSDRLRSLHPKYLLPSKNSSPASFNSDAQTLSCRRQRPIPTINFRDWDPDRPASSREAGTSTAFTNARTSGFSSTSAAARALSPISRYIVDCLRRNGFRWCPEVVAELTKLRRVTPDLVAEVLRFANLPPSVSARFFHWAGKQKRYSHSYAAYNAFAYSLHRCGQHRSADQVLELMLAQGKPPTEKQFEILIRFHADAGRGLRLHHVYTKMRRKFEVKPRVFLYNRIMEALVRSGHLDLALSVYGDFKQDGLKEEGTTFMILAKGFCGEGKVDEALELLGKMKSECCKPDVFAYTSLVKLLMREGHLDGCLKVWKEINKDGVQLDAMAYKTMIVGLCYGGRVEEGHRLFIEMKRKKLLADGAVYQALVDGFVKDGRVGKGCELLNEMVRGGYRVELGIYDSLISGLCAASKVDKAEKLFRIALQDGHVPGFETLNPLLVAYSEMGNMDLFFGILTQIDGLGVPVLDLLLKFFTSFLGSGEKASQGEEVFEALKEKGYCSIPIYNVLIECFRKSKEEAKAISLFGEMETSANFKPDSTSYSSVIPCFIEMGDVGNAYTCYSQMKDLSWIPSTMAYCSLVKGLCGIANINAAIELVKDCLRNVENGPMEFKYSLTIIQACKSGSADAVIRAIDEMIEQAGSSLEDIVCCAAIYGFSKYSNPKQAKKVLADLKNRSLITESRMYMFEEILNEYLKTTATGLLLSGLELSRTDAKLKLHRTLKHPHQQ